MSTNPFADLQTALSNLGLDFTLSGILLGAVLSIALLIILMFVLDPKGKGNQNVLLIAGGIGIAVSTGVGWFPIWIPIFFGVVIFAVWIFSEQRGG
ncbi:MAG TPA: hypothetical protein VJ044_17600 [Candidatus Hodarchaeales archaeon]|nr:hypothetical protein [Candidatus Hodarchaeales archaeon]